MPDENELNEFKNIIEEGRKLPVHFTRDVIMKAPPDDIMNSMTKSILILSSYDKLLKNTDLGNTVRQCIQLVAEIPLLAVYAYNHFTNNCSMYIHRSYPLLSTAENLLILLRLDKKYTTIEVGHTVYSMSDPRGSIFKSFVIKLAEEKGRKKDITLY